MKNALKELNTEIDRMNWELSTTRPQKASYYIKQVLYALAIFLIAMLTIAYCHPVAANTDYYDHYLSQQISLEELSRIEREADEAWIAENGEYQPNLTPEAAQYLQSEAEKIQEQRNVRK